MVFTITTNAIVSNYSLQQRMIVINSAEGLMTSALQQLYYTVTLDEIEPGNITLSNPIPKFIDNQPYIVEGYLGDNLLTLTFYYPDINLRHNSTVTLGPNAVWDGGVLNSLNDKSVISVLKVDSSTLRFSFK
jgi:hypothetical protein